jgi:hypothetical protein
MAEHSSDIHAALLSRCLLLLCCCCAAAVLLGVLERLSCSHLSITHVRCTANALIVCPLATTTGVLELLNCLLSAGEVPGLFGPDELAKDAAALEAKRTADSDYTVRQPWAARLLQLFFCLMQESGSTFATTSCIVLQVG